MAYEKASYEVGGDHDSFVTGLWDLLSQHLQLIDGLASRNHPRFFPTAFLSLSSLLDSIPPSST